MKEPQILSGYRHYKCIEMDCDCSPNDGDSSDSDGGDGHHHGTTITSDGRRQTQRRHRRPKKLDGGNGAQGRQSEVCSFMFSLDLG